MKKILSIMLAGLLVLAVSGCSEAPKELTNVGVFEDYQLELTDAEKFTNDEGQSMVRVNAVYTNNATDPEYGLACL